MTNLEMMIKLMNTAMVYGDDHHVYIDTGDGTLILPKTEADMPIKIIDEYENLVWADNT